MKVSAYGTLVIKMNFNLVPLALISNTLNISKTNKG